MRTPILLSAVSTFLLLLAPGCSDRGSEAHRVDPERDDGVPSGGPSLAIRSANGGGSRAQNEALAALERESGTRWSTRFSPRGGISSLSGRLEGARGAGENAGDAARRFLRSRSELTGIDEREIGFTGEHSADGGDTVARFARTIDGRRVVGGTVNVRFDASGALVSVSSDGWTSERGAVNGAEQSEAVVRTALGANVVAIEPIWFGTTPAFAVVVGGATESDDQERVVVDARDASILSREKIGEHAFAEVKMRDAIGVQRTIEVETKEANGGSMWSHDGSARHYANWCNATTTCNLVGTPMQSAYPGAVVSALANIRATRDAFLTTWGRNGIGGSDLRVLSRVHDGSGKEQAQWSSRDGRSGVAGVFTFFLPGAEEFSTAGAIDLVAHEYTHGVVSYTLGLGSESAPGSLAGAAREARALNESLADVFGIYAKKFACDRGYTVNCGVLFHYNEMAFTRAYYVRDIADPAKPAAYSGPGNPQHDDYASMLAAGAEEHNDAGVATKAWYLAARGGRHPKSKIGPRAGIGTKDAWDIWYAAAFAPNERAPFLSFHDFAVKTIDAARSKYKSETDWRYRAVACAWRAVGVGSDWGQCDPCPNKSKASATGGMKTSSLRPTSFGNADVLIDGNVVRASVGKGGFAWLKVEAKIGERIDLSVKNATGDVDVQAFDASGNVIARSEQIGDRPEWLDLVPDANGVVFLRFLGQESSTFDVQLGNVPDDELVIAPDEDSCVLPTKPSCEVEKEDFCGAGVCSRNGVGGFCCRAPEPVKTPCLGDSECGPNEVCAQVQAAPDGDGLSFSCVRAGTDACTD